MRHLVAVVLVALAGSVDARLAALDGVWVGADAGPPITCAWTSRGVRVSGECVLDVTEGPAAGDYVVAGRRQGKHLRLVGRRPDGVHVRVRSAATDAGWSARVRVHGAGLVWTATASLAADPTPSTAAWPYQAACGRCHGADARGLPGRPAVRCNRAVAETARTGLDGGAMPAIAAGQFSDDELARIQDALAALCAADDDATRAADLYASNCARCHGPDAAGADNQSGTQGPDIRCKTTQLLLSDIAAGDSRMPAFPELTGGADAEIAAWVRARCDHPAP